MDMSNDKFCNFLSDGALFKNAYKTHAQTAIYVFI